MRDRYRTTKQTSFWVAFMAMFVVSTIVVAQDGQGTYDPVDNHPDCTFFNLILPVTGPTQWTGSCENGLVQGKGILTFETETGEVRFSGIFKDGIMNGQGELSFWIVRNGKRKRTHYTGAFKDGFMNGIGELKLLGLGVYSGEFMDGTPNGRGVWKFDDGTKFEGTYINGELIDTP